MFFAICIPPPSLEKDVYLPFSKRNVPLLKDYLKFAKCYWRKRHFFDVYNIFLWCFMVFFSTDCLNRTTYATFVNKITPLHIVRNNLKFKVLVIFNVYRVLTLVMPMSKYQVSSMKETDVTLIWHIFPIKISMAARIFFKYLSC